MKFITLIIALFAFSQLDAKQKYYKWTDASGNTHYSETKPVDKQTTEIKVSSKQPEVVTHNATTDEPPMNSDNEELTNEQKAVAQYNKDEQERVTKAQNKANCQIAKKNLATLQHTQRVTRKNPATGEYIRMDDSQRINMLKAAKKSIKELCK